MKSKRRKEKGKRNDDLNELVFFAHSRGITVAVVIEPNELNVNEQ